MRLGLQQKEQIFHEIEAGVRSGKTFQDTVKRIAAGRGGGVQRVAHAMSRAPADGTAEEWFAAAGSVFPSLDREIVRSGEISGRLDRALAYLRDYYGALSRARRRMVAKLTYPVFLFHLGAVLLALPSVVGGGLPAFVSQVASLLASFYLAAALLWLMVATAARAGNVSPAADRLLQALPVVGGARVALIGSRFCTLMGLLVRSGASILTSLERSASASGSASFRQAAGKISAAVRQGAALSPTLIATRAFPEDIDRAFQTGEESGRLDDELARQGDRFTERLFEKLDALSAWLPTLIYLAILGALGWKIIQFWMGYFQGVQTLLNVSF